MRVLVPPGPDVDDLWPLYALPERPHVRAGFVVSVDGAVAVEGTSRPLSGDADRAALRTLRAVSDVVLVGAGTARREDYGPVPLPEDLRRRRLDEGRQERPALAVVTRTLDLDPAGRLLADPERPVLVLAPHGVEPPRPLPAAADVVRCGDGEVDLGAALRALHDRGLVRVHCEGGPQLLAGLLAADLVDELCLTTSPLLVGAGPPLLPQRLESPLRARLAGLVEADGVLLARWSLRS